MIKELLIGIRNAFVISALPLFLLWYYDKPLWIGCLGVYLVALHATVNQIVNS